MVPVFPRRVEDGPRLVEGPPEGIVPAVVVAALQTILYDAVVPPGDLHGLGGDEGSTARLEDTLDEAR